MNNLIIAILGGAVACAIYWTDHTMVRSEKTPIDKTTLGKYFAGGTILVYVALMMAGTPAPVPGTVAVPSDMIGEILDEIKTGRPSF